MVQKKGGKRQSGNPAVRSGSSLPASGSTPSTPPTGARARLERASAPALVTLARLPRWVFPIALAALLVAGLMLNPGWVGAILLLVLVALLLWLTALSWPVLSPTGRLLRTITIVAALAVTFARASGSL